MRAILETQDGNIRTVEISYPPPDVFFVPVPKTWDVWSNPSDVPSIPQFPQRVFRLRSYGDWPNGTALYVECDAGA